MSAKVITACRQPPTECNAAEDPLKKISQRFRVWLLRFGKRVKLHGRPPLPLLPLLTGQTYYFFPN